MRSAFFFFLCSLIVVSCSKKDSGDKEAPVVTILSPSNNQSFTPGQTIQVEGRATDNEKITEFHIHITHKTTGALLRDIHAYPGQATGTTSYSFAAEAGMGYKIELVAKDPAQNSGSAAVTVTVN